MAWSNEQLAAIETLDKNILVAAAAGSGKTSVLVERIIRRVLDSSRNFDVDRVLVVTFTNAAAAEMRQRISAALQRALAENPESAHLKRQLALLNAASITTIDAFCQSVVKQNFHLLGIRPNFRIAGEAELELLQYEAIENLFEVKYQAKEPGFLNVIGHYGKQFSDDKLYEMLLDLYVFSRSHPEPDQWLNHVLDAYDVHTESRFRETAWGGFLRGKIEKELRRCLDLVKKSKDIAAAEQFLYYNQTLEQDELQIVALLDAFDISWETAAQAFEGCAFSRLASAPKDADPEVKDELKERRELYKSRILKLKDRFFSATFLGWTEELKQIAPIIRQITLLTREFAASYAAAKLERGIVDFYDLEHFCLRLLREKTEGGYRPSPVALALQEKYHEVMIDEVQDTNGLQEAILHLVRRNGAANLFLVGDVKQSIYRFRLAEPELFNEKYHTYPQLGSQYALIRLSNNYRSRKTVIDAVNFLFSQIMTPECAEIDYRGAELCAQAAYPEAAHTLDGPVEVCLMDRAGTEKTALETGQSDEEESAFAAEARWIASRIAALMEEGRSVFENGSYRPLQLRDIVILLRAVKGKSGILLEALRARGIAAYAELSSGYFAAMEIRTMLALLAVLDNPRQDIELAAVLHCPVVGLTAAELAEIRLADTEGDLWTALNAFINQQPSENVYLNEKIAWFLKRFETWREVALRKSVPELIWQLYDETGYYDYVGAMEGGVLRQANLRMLYDRARDYEATNFRGLFRFLRFIEKMRAKETDLSIARTLSENEDVVRIMSIHKSKGLEFPVVFVADIGKGFNLQDQNRPLLLHKRFGVGAFITSDADSLMGQLRYPSLVRSAIAWKSELESKSEEMRVLYVALTRAKEKLILVGSVRNLAKRIVKWQMQLNSAQNQLPPECIEGAHCFLDWIVPALLYHRAGKVLYEYTASTPEFSGSLWDDPSRWQIEIVPAVSAAAEKPMESESSKLFLKKVEQLAPVAPTEYKACVEAVLKWHYPHQAAVDKPAKLSVTEMKRRFDNEAPEFPVRSLEFAVKRNQSFLRPRFEQVRTALTAAEYGTVMHAVMQHLPLSLSAEKAAINGFIHSLVQREILLHEQAAQVHFNSIQRFLQSSLAERMRQSSCVRREMPFSILLPAHTFYPDLEDQGETLFVQGIVDVLFDEPDGLVLIDYKTDRAQPAEYAVSKHRYQLNLYAEAIEKIFRKKVKEQHLYLISTGKFVKVERMPVL